MRRILKSQTKITNNPFFFKFQNRSRLSTLYRRKLVSSWAWETQLMLFAALPFWTLHIHSVPPLWQQKLMVRRTEQQQQKLRPGRQAPCSSHWKYAVENV